jgi:hypothetical protein
VTVVSIAQPDEMTARPDSRAGAAAAATGVTLRRMPYPYRAMLAIASDLDETPDRRVYAESMRFLNTCELTAMGRGLGLEIGNSIYFDMPPDQFAYWNTDDAGRAMVQAMIRSGHVDVVHSFGDLATTRAHAHRALDELARHGCRPEVWIDHAVAPTNFGPDIMRGQGDVPGAAAYHADLTHDFGIRYVWRGRVTSVIGQGVPRSLRGILKLGRPAVSLRTAAKELAKGLLARAGSEKYAMHGQNAVLRRASLRSRHEVFEFLRSNPCWRAVDRGETADGIAEVLVPSMLRHLVRREGVCILYTHLGKVRRRDEPFGLRTRTALRLLAREHRTGHVLVTTTRRVLGYCRALGEIICAVTPRADGVRIDVSTGLPDRDLAGLTFYVADPGRTAIVLNGREATAVRRNAADDTGRRSISLPWPALEFPRW